MPSSKPGSRLIRAAGAVAWRPGPDGEPEILLVHRKKYDDWSLPKGKTEPGEPLPITAVREVLEEGGARLVLGRRLASVRYKVGGRPKRVHYWAARVTSADDHAVPNAEVDKVAWVPAASAAGRVSYSHDHGVLADFARLPAGTVPLILLRHAKAQPKSGWEHDDTSRPLDDSGHADAKILAELLACFAPGAVLISSPAARCLETLRPFAALSGALIREDPSLAIKSPGTDPADFTPLIASAIAGGTPTVVCAHRENIPALQAAALTVLGAATPPGEPGEWSEPLPLASFWVLNVVPLPVSPEPVSPEPASPLAASPRPFRFLPRWLRGRRRAGPGEASTGVAAVTSQAPGGGAATGPAGMLVSGDRYGLSVG